MRWRWQCWWHLVDDLPIAMEITGAARTQSSWRRPTAEPAAT
jgi:hypothetical protein